MTIHNTLAVRRASTRNQSTQWYPSRSISCVDRQGQVHHFPLQAEYPGQTAVPWRFLMHIPQREMWLGDVPRQILREARPRLEALYAGPMLNIRGGQIHGRRALYVIGRHKRLVKNHVQIWFVEDDRPINGYISDTVSPCVPVMDQCEINVHLHEVHSPYQRAATLHFGHRRLRNPAQHDMLVITGYELRAILTKCF